MMRLLAPVRRSTFLVLLGAALVSVALTVGIIVRGPTPVAATTPEPVVPAGSTSSAGVPPPAGTTTSPPPETTEPPAQTTSSPPMAAPSEEKHQHGGNFRAVAGPACPVDATRTVKISTGWQVVPGDSWTGDGCGNRFLYSEADDPNYVQWRFTFDGDAARSCKIAVFVPDSPLSSEKVWYGITDRPENMEYRVGGFTINQKANHGRWVNGMTVAIGTDTLVVNVNGNQGLTGVSAGPLRVSCTSSAM